MAKFRFRMQPLLRMREADRDERRRQLADALAVQEVVAEQISATAEQLQKLRDARRPQCGAVNVDRLIDAHRYEMVLSGQQRQLEQQQTAVLAEVDRRRNALVDADREVKILEKLREQQLARHQAEEFRRENQFMDEVAGRRAPREVTS